MNSQHNAHNTIQIHHRRSIRLQGYNYSNAGAYFITLCTQNKECLLGNIMNNGRMRLNYLGEVAATSWQWLATQYAYVELDEWVVMPNHMHGIIVISDGLNSKAGLKNPRKSLGELIGAFKTVSTKQINAIRNTPSTPLWQRNYWEHIVRNEQNLNTIPEYIINNPVQWEFDKLNPDYRMI